MYSASGWMIYVHPGPDSICAFAPHHCDGFIKQPMTNLGFAKAGLTCFAINFILPKQSPELVTINDIFFNATNYLSKLHWLPVAFSSSHYCPNHTSIFISQCYCGFIKTSSLLLLRYPATQFVCFAITDFHCCTCSLNQ